MRWAVSVTMRQLMRERRKLAVGDDDNFNIFDTQQLAETLSSTMSVLTRLLGAVAAVSLMVGGIGIMNIMLVSVDRAHSRNRFAAGRRRPQKRGIDAVLDRGRRALGAWGRREHHNRNCCLLLVGP